MMCKLYFLDHLIIFDSGLSWNHEKVTKEISTNDLSSTNGILACGLVFQRHGVVALGYTVIAIRDQWTKPGPGAFQT